MAGLSARADKRRARAVESFGSAADCVGPIEPGMSLFAVTRGQFSMLDIVAHCIREVGPCHVSCWTWAIAEYEIQCFEAFMHNKEIVGGRLIIDRAGAKRSHGLLADWKTNFGPESVRVCKNHAKICRIETSEVRLLIRGSMNLNFNPRFEQFDITEGGPDYDLVNKLESELPVLEEPLTNMKADNASRLGNAYEAAELALFDGVQVWAK